MSKILIVDDEKDIAELISDVLVDEGFETVTTYDGEDALEKIKKNTFDLILLDIMMPKMSGTEVCLKIRNITNTPVIFVTAKNAILDKVLGFELGADDYITKPFVNEELTARVKAHIRRETRNIPDKIIYEIGEIKINTSTIETFKNNKLIELSTREFELLTYLMKNAGLELSKEEIFESVWGSTYGDIGIVAVNIKSLRNKLDNEEKYIKTIWGYGYKFIKVID